MGREGDGGGFQRKSRLKENKISENLLHPPFFRPMNDCEPGISKRDCYNSWWRESIPPAGACLAASVIVQKKLFPRKHPKFRRRVSERLNMSLEEYFKTTKGIGVLATTDASGQVNQAIYSKPFFLDEDDDGNCSFIMSNRLSHDNVEHNPSASYLFVEEGKDFIGKRLSLTVIGEEASKDKIREIRHRNLPSISEEESKYLVHFHIEGVRPLIGSG
jgi:hypothetical protein